MLIFIGFLIVLGLFGNIYLLLRKEKPKPNLTTNNERYKYKIGSEGKAKKINLDVVVLSTSYGIESLQPFAYPKLTSVEIPENLEGRITVYGVGEKVVVGSKDWTGEGSIGADGTTFIALYPIGGSQNNGPRLFLSEVPACVGCALGDAAVYFEDAKRLYEKDFPAPLEIPEGLKVSPLSSNLVKYSLLDTSEGLAVNGVAYFKMDNTQPYFIKIEVTMSREQSDLSNFLLNSFTSMYNLQ